MPGKKHTEKGSSPLEGAAKWEGLQRFLSSVQGLTEQKRLLRDILLYQVCGRPEAVGMKTLM